MRSGGWVREFGGRRLGLPVLVLGLLAVSALASREPLSASGKPGGAASGGLRITASPWQFVLIAGAGLVAFIWLVIYGGFSRRTPVGGGLPRVLLRLVILLVASLLLAGAIEGLHRRAAPQRRLAPPLASPRAVSARSSSWFTVPVWVTWGIVGTFVAGALVAVVGTSARRRPPGAETLPSAFESALDAALIDLDAIADPRLAIIAAYRRMEESLAGAGFPRAAAEAPREYMGRIASALELEPQPLVALTNLFEAARFSLRQLDAAARGRAMTALRALQAQLA